MKTKKEKIDNIIIFTLGDVYTTDDFRYFWDITMEKDSRMAEVLNARHVIIDCTNLKKIEETSGELFFLQQRFENETEGQFLYCGLGDEQKQMLSLLSKEITKVENFTLKNFDTRKEALDSLM